MNDTLLELNKSKYEHEKDRNGIQFTKCELFLRICEPKNGLLYRNANHVFSNFLPILI